MDRSALRAHLERGREARLRGRLEASLRHFEAALRLDPDCARAHAGRGGTLAKLGRASDAIDAYRGSLRIEPDQPRVYAALGDLYLDLCFPETAVECFRIALAGLPGHEILRSNFLYALNLDPRAQPEEIFREHAEFGRRMSEKTSPLACRAARVSERKLKIGYVSADFRDHPVSYSFEPILEHHSRRHFEITLYSSTIRPDFLTRRLKRIADQWRDVRSASDDQLASNIREDRIDILVDLGGHTSVARLGAFAQKPAPVQVTYLGYPNTTGLSEIDYRLTDEWADPPGETERWHTERLERIEGGFLCFHKPDISLPVQQPPCLRRGAITFGSCSKPRKWNLQVIETWAAILRRTPGSRLLLHHSTAAVAHSRVLESFLALGIAPDRISIAGALDWRSHWEWFHQIDLALDPFPYNGTNASCETLWMGVPFIALEGCTHAARVGVSLLTRLGLESLIASDCGEYADLAGRLASDVGALKSLRAGMRRRLRSCTLMDTAGFTRRLEDAYRRIWAGKESGF